MNYLVSIILPVHNVENYINNCLESLINQTYKNIEIILVDDGSTDNSGKICDKYKKIDKRITVIHNQNNGVSYSRNYGINLARGKYLIFVDPDDYVDIDYIENLLKPLYEKDYDLVICNIDHIYQNKIVNNFVDVIKLSNDYYEDFYYLNILRATPVNKLFKRDIIKYFNIRFLENVCFSEDRIFNYHYAVHVKSYKYIDKAMYHYCHGEKQSLSKARSLKAYKSAMIALQEEKLFLNAKKVSNKDIILTDSAISYLHTFSKLDFEKATQYKNFYERAENIRKILDNYFYHNKLKRKIVSICLKYNIIWPLYIYYCVIKTRL